jgi:hypothetical protein
MRFRLAAITLAVAAFAGGALAPSSARLAAPHVALAKTCSSGYVHASLPWGEKCLRAGEYCKHSGDRYYHRYGFHCHKRDSRGSYHLTR